MFALNCCTRPCLKLRFCDCRAPGKTGGVSGDVMTGRNAVWMPQPGVPMFWNRQSPSKLSDSARYGGFCHNPCAPWFHDESWKIAYPKRSAVFSLPIGFHEIPMRGSMAVLSNWIPTRPFDATQIVHPASAGLFQ